MDKITLTNYLDHIYIINLDHRTDRWAKMINLLQTLGLNSNDSIITRFSAIAPDLYANTIIKKSYQYFNIPDGIKKDNKKIQKYIKGALGCKMSHYQIIQDAARNNYRQILILEDDVCLAPNLSVDKFFIHFRKMMWDLENLGHDWAMCYLGGKNVGDVKMVGKKTCS